MTEQEPQSLDPEILKKIQAEGDALLERMQDPENIRHIDEVFRRTHQVTTEQPQEET